MTHRCSTERDEPGTVRDGFNHPVTAPVAVLSDHPCYWQSSSERFIADGQKVASVAAHMLLLPLDTDIKEQDRVTSIQDRRGRTLKGGKLRVLPLVRRETHLEAMLEEYS